MARKRWLLAAAVSLPLLFTPAALSTSALPTKALAPHEAVESNLEPLDASVAIELVLPSTTTLPPPTTTTTATTSPPPTTTTTEPVPETASESNAMESGNGDGDPNDYASWDRLAQCESGGNWSINTGNGYYGGIQFSLSSWQAVGGTGYPHEHSRETQIAMGQRLHAQGGWSHWPGCTRSFGWR